MEDLGLWGESSALHPLRWYHTCESRSNRLVSGPVAGYDLSSLCPLHAPLNLRLLPDLLPRANKPHFSVEDVQGSGQALWDDEPDGANKNLFLSQLTSKGSQAWCEKVIVDCWILIRRKLSPCKAKDHQERRVREGHPTQNAPKWPSGNISYTCLWSEWALKSWRPSMDMVNLYVKQK